MYKIMSLLVLSFAFSGAVHAEENGEKFAQRKAERLAELDERIQKLQEHKSCISAAVNHEAMKNCRESMQEWRESERAERKGRREGRKQKKE